MDIKILTLDEWEQHLPDDGFEVFHTSEALEVMDRHFQGELRLYGGFKGDQAIGLLPVFERRQSVGRAVLSPPPSRGIPHLGPILMPTSPKRRKREQVNQRFIEGVLDELSIDSSRTLVRIICPTSYTDPRPYRWGGLNVGTKFTYHLGVEGDDPEQILRSFSKSLRREIRDLEDTSVSVEVEPDSRSAAGRVYEDIMARYAEQDEPFSLTRDYVLDLVTALDNRCRVYVVRDEHGEYLTGLVVLYSNDAAYYWEGGARATYNNVSVNSLLHWSVIRDITVDPKLESVSRYDMVGANTRRLSRYKAKFSPDLIPYYAIESKGLAMDLAKTAYGWLNRR